MPIIFTRGSLSARGAGTFAYIPPAPTPPPPPGPPPPPPPPGPPGPVLQRVVFTSSGSWTCPAGVTSLSTLTINAGQYGETPGTWQYTTGNFNFAFYSAQGTTDPGSQSSAYTYSQVGALSDSALTSLNIGAPAERDASFLQIYNYYNPNTGGFYNGLQTYTQRIRGTAVPALGPWDNRSNEIVQGVGTGWYFGVEVYYPPEVVDGTPSSAFGYTVQGGTVSNPTPSATYTSIPVTPGQTYNITVGTLNGSVVFEFYQS